VDWIIPSIVRSLASERLDLARYLHHDQIHLAQPQNVAYNSPRRAVLLARSHGTRSHDSVECFGTVRVTEFAKKKQTSIPLHSGFVGQELDLICNHNIA
jgi:hypothetical protein